MRNKIIKIFLVWALVCAMTGAGIRAYAIFDYTDTVNATPKTSQIKMYMVKGNNLSLSCEELEKRLGLTGGALNGLTLTEVPDESNALVCVNNKRLSEYDKLSREEIDNIKVSADADAASVCFSFIADSPSTLNANVTVSILDNYNNAPQATSESYSTIKNTAITGKINAVDADGDNMRVNVTKKAKKGTVTTNGTMFVYEPYPEKTGDDSFKFICEDEYGNTSAECSINITIDKKSSMTYSDMADNMSLYGAVKLSENGVITGEKIGDNYYFYPDRQVTKGDFLIMLTAAAGYSKELPVCVNTGLINDSEIPMHLKPYVKLAVEKGIIENGAFAFDVVPTRAEAVVMTCNAAGMDKVDAGNIDAYDISIIPDWSVSSYMTLDAYKMLDLFTGYAKPDDALTRDYSADLLWQLYKYSSSGK